MQPFTLSDDDRQRLKLRRLQLAQAMQHGVCILPTRPEAARNADTHYPYRHDSSFYYLTGFVEPDAVLLLLAGERPRSVLFCRVKDPEREIWEGFLWGPEAARTMFGVDEAWPISELDQRLPELLQDQDQLFTLLGHSREWDERVAVWVNQLRAGSRRGIRAPEVWRDVRELVHEMRLFKDDSEISLMRRAADISARAHERCMRTACAGQPEYVLEAELLHEFTRSGSRYPAYPSIVASGPNACVLHYVENTRRMADGELVLIDAGCEWQGYAADITRTWPVGTRFSAEQRQLYEIVLAAQKAAIAAARPGQHWNRPHEEAVRVLTAGLVDAGLLRMSVQDALEQEAYRRFYMHRTGHWLGMDVHDCGQYKQEGQWRALQPGMVLTVEPGLYVRADDDIDPRFHHIGIRIEDDVLITADGCEVLTAAAPKEVADLEALRRDAAQRL